MQGGWQEAVRYFAKQMKLLTPKFDVNIFFKKKERKREREREREATESTRNQPKRAEAQLKSE